MIENGHALLGGWLTKYQHVERLGADECEGLLNGTVVVQEKIDGANATVARDPSRGIIVATRRHVVSIGGEPQTGFRGLVEYILGHAGIRSLLADYPNWVLRGEWLVRHSTNYSRGAEE